jgi:hypothetical protein
MNMKNAIRRERKNDYCICAATDAIKGKSPGENTFDGDVITASRVEGSTADGRFCGRFVGVVTEQRGRHRRAKESGLETG